MAWAVPTNQTALGQATAAFANVIVGDLQDTGWTAPTLTNSWVNEGSGSFENAQYRVRSGVVYVAGVIKSGTTGAAMFTLPAGARPLKELIFVCQSGTGSAFVYVFPTGVVWVTAYATGGSNTFVSLSGISPFIAEQ